MSNSKPLSDSPLPDKPTTTPPFGYRMVGNRVEIDPAQAKRVVALFRQYVQNQ
jgi:hypothetical protein